MFIWVAGLDEVCLVYVFIWVAGLDEVYSAMEPFLVAYYMFIENLVYSITLEFDSQRENFVLCNCRFLE